MKQLLIVLLLLVASVAQGQTTSSTARRVRAGTTLPATCRATNPVDVFIDSDATVTARWYICTSTNTWTAQGGSATATTAAAVIDDNAVVRGDGGARGVQNSGIVISDSNGLNCATDGGCDIGNGLADFRDLSLKRNLILRGSTSGKITFAAAATTTDYTFTWPSAAGAADTFLKSDGTWAAPTAGIGGSTGATDNAILRADGTGGATLQNSALGIDDSGSIIDVNGNELIKTTATASAVNEITIANAATGNNPVISATGGDTNIGITFTPKGTGSVTFPGSTVIDSAGRVRTNNFRCLTDPCNVRAADDTQAIVIRGSSADFLKPVLFGTDNTWDIGATNATRPRTLYLGTGLTIEATITAAATTGAQTIDKTAGSVNFAASATSLVVTSNKVTANSIVMCTVATNDATFRSAQCVPAAGSFTIFANAAATAETRVNFWVLTPD